jgi:hypothetical protein
VNDKDSKLLWEAYNNTRSKPINELNIPGPNRQSSAANPPSRKEFIAKVKELRARMIDAQTNLPYGLGKQMNPEVIDLFTVLSPSNLLILGKEFVKFARRDGTNNIFDDILAELKANEEREDPPIAPPD